MDGSSRFALVALGTSFTQTAMFNLVYLYPLTIAPLI